MGKGTYTGPKYKEGPGQAGQPEGTTNFGGGGKSGVVGGFTNKKNAAPPPDYYGAAQATSNSSKDAVNQQTQANRPNQYTGFGSNTWTKDAQGNWTQSTNLNPALGGALGNLQNQAYSNSQQPMDNGSAARDQAIKAAYGQATSRLNPQWSQSEEQLGSQLANQGLDPNSAAYRQAMQQQAFAKNDAYGSAMNSAIAQGTAAQQATFNENMASQMAPYQQMGYLQNFQNGMPGFNASGQYAPANYLGAAEAMGGYGLQAQQLQGQMDADRMAGIGKFLSMSDERVKTDIKRLPTEAYPGIPMATFKYKHAPERGHHLGVIAQDVEKVRPDAVATDEGGIKHVNYSKLKPFGVK
jgi:hypothetical protein